MSNLSDDDDLVPFSDLPKDMQDAVTKGLTEPHEWTFLTSADLNVVKNPGQRLKHLRLEREWTQEELAHKAGVELTDVSLAEENIGKSKTDNLEKITAALGTTPKELLFGHS